MILLIDCPWCGSPLREKELRAGLGTGSTCPCCSKPIRIRMVETAGRRDYDVSQGRLHREVTT